MKFYSPKNHLWYDQMIKKGYVEKDEAYYSVFAHGNPSKIFYIILNSNATKDQKLLDIGCGYGKYTQMFAERYGEVIGLDLSPESIELAKKKYAAANLTYIIADSTQKLPFEDESFDAVSTRLSPHNLSEMFRILKPGSFALCMRVGETDSLDLRKQFGQEATVKKMQDYIDRGERHSQHIVEEWKAVGFTNVTCTEHEYDMHFESLGELARYLSRIPIVPNLIDEILIIYVNLNIM